VVGCLIVVSLTALIGFIDFIGLYVSVAVTGVVYWTILVLHLH